MATADDKQNIEPTEWDQLLFVNDTGIQHFLTQFKGKSEVFLTVVPGIGRDVDGVTLDRKTAIELIQALKNFVDTGSLVPLPAGN